MSVKQSFLIAAVASLILFSCSKKSGEGRPSPFATDSVNLSFTNLKVAYSSPGVKNRKIWGELVPYGNVWRTGANEATVFETSENININGENLPAGKYSIFTIPTSQNWTIVFNKDWDQWGAYNYDASKNALLLSILPEQAKDYQERLKFYFKDQKLIFHWETLKFGLDITQP